MVAGNITFPPFMGPQEDLFPCGEWGSAPRSLGENKGRASPQVIMAVRATWEWSSGAAVIWLRLNGDLGG